MCVYERESLLEERRFLSEVYIDVFLRTKAALQDFVSARCAFCQLTALLITFVPPVTAVVVAITQPGLVYTLHVVTLDLVWSTGGVV